MDQDTKIVFVHKGSDWYLPYVINQARHSNPDSDIVFIGDSYKHKTIKTVTLLDLENESVNEFKRLYLHKSTNAEQYELFCWLRWFYLLRYMHKYNVTSVLYLDSDVLLYSSIKYICNLYAEGHDECGILIPKEHPDAVIWVASAHTSYWSRDYLEAYCAFILESFSDKAYLKRYEDKWNWHLTNSRSGGVSDMTTLYFFWETNKNDITNLAKNYKGNVFDLNIKLGRNYEYREYVREQNLKKLDFSNGIPYMSRLENPSMKIRAHSLHFQGESKKYIERYYKGEPVPIEERDGGNFIENFNNTLKNYFYSDKT